MGNMNDALSGALDTIQAAAETQTENPEDYRNDNGLLVCGICGDNKEIEIECLGQKKIVRCLCSCEEAERDKKEADFEELQRQMRIKRLREWGIRDGRLLNCRFETAEDSIYLQKCKEYADHWAEVRKSGIGMLLYGATGSGKTFAAACIANELMSKGYPVIMTSFPDILAMSREEAYELERDMKKCDLAIIDDFGTERNTEYGAEVVYRIIDALYRSGHPMIITTNLSVSELDNTTNVAYKRICKRIVEVCVPMHFAGDKRGGRRASAAAKLKEIIHGTQP